MLEMPDKCSVCDLKFEIEPGFWVGAMWISYPIVLAIVFPFLALFAEGYMTWIYFAAMIVAFLVFWPFMLRVGRSAWIYVNVRYEDENS